MTTTLITGATRGVGLELSRRLPETGHTVYLGARDLGRGRELAEPIGARAIAIDVTDDASVRAAVEHLRQEIGALDVLVNNAGISGMQRPPAEADIEDLETVVATNVIGATRVLVACTPLLEMSARLEWVHHLPIGNTRLVQRSPVTVTPGSRPITHDYGGNRG